MKTKIFTFFSLPFLAVSVFAQTLSEDYKVISVNKKVSEISYDKPYESPLQNYVACMRLWIDGRDEPIHSEMIDHLISKNAKPYPEKASENLLSSKIGQVVTYKDSVGLVFRKEKSDPDYYLVGFSQWENGKWLHKGEDLCHAKNMNEAAKYIESHSTAILKCLRQYYKQKIVSTDTLAFLDYLHKNGQKPVALLINSLKNHKIVMYGEQHFRKNSWDLLNELIRSPDFSTATGAVFMELSINAQPLLDDFFSSKEKNTNLILNVFRNEELTGWADRGMYDFLVALWDTNAKLPEGKKIKVFAADFPRPFYNNVTTKEQYEDLTKASDRNEYMANAVENYINSTTDKRNCLFVVGCGHAYKSGALLRGRWQTSGKSAANLLCEIFGKDSVFTICTHAPIISNNGIILGKTRKGIFDWVFAQNGNIPVAFDFKDSPFGKEPYDADADIRYDIATGSYANNYDGYIFLLPPEEELSNMPLFELFTDEYIDEIKRRAKVLNCEDDTFYGMKLKDLNQQVLTNKLKLEGIQKRWNFPE
ncbi:MAG: ChaN family lipoprotein [Prevotellaceae bacterium]|jgi:hypothetical protein|nr:ChaN family lipoprotein [Prevotellaceae bacterium]